MQTQEFTAEQVQAMREALRKIDESAKPRSIDMSQPVIVPYPKHQPFPKLVYDHERSLPSRFEMKDSIIAGGAPVPTAMPPKFETKVVKNQAELDAALAEGWRTDAPVFNEESKSKRRSKVA